MQRHTRSVYQILLVCIVLLIHPTDVNAHSTNSLTMFANLTAPVMKDRRQLTSVWFANNLPSLAFRAVASNSDGSSLFAAVYNGGIYYSTNYGSTFSLSNAPSAAWSSIASDSVGLNVYATIAGGMIYRSSTSGVTWVTTSTESTTAWSGIACSDTGAIVAACVNGGDIYLSLNHGDLFEVMTGAPAPSAWTGISMDWTQNNYLSATCSGCGIWYTEAGPPVATVGWGQAAGAPLNGTFSAIAVDIMEGEYVTVTAPGVGIWVSVDLGITYTLTFSVADDWSDIACDNTCTNIFATSKTGQIYSSTNHGASFDIFLGSSTQAWSSIASNSDGTRLIAAYSPTVSTGGLYQFNPNPTSQPSTQPSSKPSSQPTTQPFSCPSSQPTMQPFGKPSAQPSFQPNSRPSAQPSRQPSSYPTDQPTSRPSGQPTVQPSYQPSLQPTAQPTIQPSDQPSSHPSVQQSAQPSYQPSVQPTAQPSIQPSHQPSSQPSVQPTLQPSNNPSSQPSAQPTMQPLSSPSSQPSISPSGQPSAEPTMQPTHKPSSLPSGSPSCAPTVQPSGPPSAQPTRQPSSQPSAQPSVQPSAQPTRQPTQWTGELLIPLPPYSSAVVDIGSALLSVVGSQLVDCQPQASTIECTVYEAVSGSLVSNFALPWQRVTSMVAGPNTDTIVLSGLFGNTTRLESCTLQPTPVICTSIPTVAATSISSGSYNAYSHLWAYTSQLSSCTAVVLFGTNYEQRALCYSSKLMGQFEFINIFSIPAFVGSFVAGTSTSNTALPRNYIVAGVVRLVTGDISAGYYAPTPTNSSIIRTEGLVVAQVVDANGPFVNIVGGMELNDGRGVQAYILRTNALTKGVLYCVRYMWPTPPTRRHLLDAPIASSSVQGIALVGTFTFLLVATSHTDGVTVLRVSSTTGAILQQATITVTNSSMSCSSLVSAGDMLAMTCLHSSLSFVYVFDQKLSFQLLPARMSLSRNVTLQAVPSPFIAATLPVTSYTDLTPSSPTHTPVQRPTARPTALPTIAEPTSQPSGSPTSAPTVSAHPTSVPSTSGPTNTQKPTQRPSIRPTTNPSCQPSVQPSVIPTTAPTPAPTRFPHLVPALSPL